MTISSDILMMPCLGPDLKSIMKKTSKFNIFTVKRIGYQLIHRLEELHSHGYIHRDLKPENILLGNQENPHKIYLVDLGLATEYKKNVSRPKKMYDGVIGTAKFCSLASHKGLEQFPKDDI